MKSKIIKEPVTCKGLYWRGSVSTFLSSHRSIEVRKSLRLLKRKSCTGCHKCEWLWEYLNEDIWGSSKLGGDNDYIGKIKDGKIYTFQVNTSQGYYDQYPEIDNIDFIEIKDET